MAVFSLICGLAGCHKAPKPAKHELSEISSVSISCGHMDRSYGYSFYVHRVENGWVLEAECFTNQHESETVLENCELSGEDAQALLEILEQNERIAYAENYRKPKKLSAQTADEPAYSFCLTFSDGNQYVTCDRQDGLEEFCYRIAEKYKEEVR